MQLFLLLAFVVFILCLPVRLVLSLCCGVKLQPPGHRPPGATSEEDGDEDDRNVVINMPQETVAPDQVSTQQYFLSSEATFVHWLGKDVELLLADASIS